jgi:transposase-like protein
MAEFGLKSLSSTQVSRAAKLLDDELDAWRSRTLGEVRYLFLDARYEKSRQGGVVRDAAVLSAVGVGPDGRRRVLGVSVAVSEAEVHWRAFLEDLVARGMRGVQFVTSDDHAGLEAARKAVLGGAVWQRCQFHLAQNAIHHAPNIQIRKCIGSQLREIWNAKNLATAEAELKCLVEAHRKNAPELAAWLEVAIPEGLAVFTLPEHHRKRMRTSNPIERAVQQELKRRTVKVRVFPNNASLLRLVTAVLVEIDETWQASTQPYINWKKTQMPDRATSEFPDIRLRNRQVRQDRSRHPGPRGSVRVLAVIGYILKIPALLKIGRKSRDRNCVMYIHGKNEAEPE